MKELFSLTTTRGVQKKMKMSLSICSQVKSIESWSVSVWIFCLFSCHSKQFNVHINLPATTTVFHVCERPKLCQIQHANNEELNARKVKVVLIYVHIAIHLARHCKSTTTALLSFFCINCVDTRCMYDCTTAAHSYLFLLKLCSYIYAQTKTTVQQLRNGEKQRCACCITEIF